MYYHTINGCGHHHFQPIEPRTLTRLRYWNLSIQRNLHRNPLVSLIFSRDLLQCRRNFQLSRHKGSVRPPHLFVRPPFRSELQSTQWSWQRNLREWFGNLWICSWGRCQHNQWHKEFNGHKLQWVKVRTVLYLLMRKQLQEQSHWGRDE